MRQDAGTTGSSEISGVWGSGRVAPLTRLRNYGPKVPEAEHPALFGVQGSRGATELPRASITHGAGGSPCLSFPHPRHGGVSWALRTPPPASAAIRAKPDEIILQEMSLKVDQAADEMSYCLGGEGTVAPRPRPRARPADSRLPVPPGHWDQLEKRCPLGRGHRSPLGWDGVLDLGMLALGRGIWGREPPGEAPNTSAPGWVAAFGDFLQDTPGGMGTTGASAGRKVGQEKPSSRAPPRLQPHSNSAWSQLLSSTPLGGARKH